MRLKVVFFAALVGLAGALVVFGACRQRPEPASDPPNADAPIVAERTRSKPNDVLDLEYKERRPIGVVSPQQLYDAFTRNLIAAEANYEGQFVKVVGPLVGMRRDADVAILKIGLGATYAPGASIDAQFNREDEGPFKDLTIGQVVSVIGSPRHDATDGLVLLRSMIAPSENLPPQNATNPNP
jgi:hypothetical protein